MYRLLYSWKNTRTQPSPMYSHSAITNVLVLSHRQCTRTQPSPMYSYSAIANVLVLSHRQCTRTRTLLMKMFSAPGLIYMTLYSARACLRVLLIFIYNNYTSTYLHSSHIVQCIANNGYHGQYGRRIIRRWRSSPETDWLTDWLRDWLTDWLTCCAVCPFCTVLHFIVLYVCIIFMQAVYL